MKSFFETKILVSKAFWRGKKLLTIFSAGFKTFKVKLTIFFLLPSCLVKDNWRTFAPSKNGDVLKKTAGVIKKFFCRLLLV